MRSPREGPEENQNPRCRSSVRGRVLFADGSPVEGVSVSWVGALTRAERAADPRETFTVASTDAEGRYEAGDLPRGPCRMVAEWPWLLGRRMHDHGEFPCTRVMRLGTRRVTAPDIRLPVDPKHLGEVEVLVLNLRRRPLEGIEVRSQSVSVPSAMRAGPSKTNARGRVVIRSVNPGVAEVNASSSKRNGFTWSRTWLPPGARTSVTLFLGAPRKRDPRLRRTLRVQCIDDAGRPIPGCRIHSFGVGGAGEAAANRSGVATLRVHLDGEWNQSSISVSGSHPGHEFASIEFPLDGPRRTLQGRLVVRRERHVEFEVRDSETGHLVTRSSLEWSNARGGSTRIGGSSTGLPVGSTVLRVSAPGYEPKSVDLRVRAGKGPLQVPIRLRPSR